MNRATMTEFHLQIFMNIQIHTKKPIQAQTQHVHNRTQISKFDLSKPQLIQQFTEHDVSG